MRWTNISTAVALETVYRESCKQHRTEKLPEPAREATLEALLLLGVSVTLTFIEKQRRAEAFLEHVASFFQPNRPVN